MSEADAGRHPVDVADESSKPGDEAEFARFGRRPIAECGPRAQERSLNGRLFPDGESSRVQACHRGAVSHDGLN